MAIRTELTLRLPNSPGALARVCGELARARVNVLALHLESSGRLRLLVDNPLHGAGVLRDLEHQVDTRDVLFVTLPNDIAAGAQALRLLSEGGVNVEYAYGAAMEGSRTAAIVVGVADAQHASALSGW